MSEKDPADSLNELLHTMQALRSETGCPWDREQTPQSLTPYILEEACELIDAIESGCNERILDELGDLLLQVVFQAQIFSEHGCFGFAEVAESINAKLWRRHPHVFDVGSTAAVVSREELDRQWDRIKRAERGAFSGQEKTMSCLLPKQMPALQRAQKLVRKMCRAGLTQSLVQHTEPQNPPQSHPPKPPGADAATAQTIGRDLLGLVLRAEYAGVDAEAALRKLVGLLGKTPLPQGCESDQTMKDSRD